jgi:hypothetical protein
MNKPNDATNGAVEPVRDIDPFADLEAFRLSPETSTVAVRQVIARVPVRKPGSQEFFRVHPDEPYRLDTGIIELRDDRETYLVAQVCTRSPPTRCDSSVCTPGPREAVPSSCGPCRCRGPTGGATAGSIVKVTGCSQ